MKALYLIGLCIILFSLSAFSLNILSTNIYDPTPSPVTNVREGNLITFEHEGQDYTTEIQLISDDYTTLMIHPSEKKINLLPNDKREIDLNSDTKPDTTIQLNDIQNKKASFTLTAVPILPETPEEEPVQDQPLPPETEKKMNEGVQSFLQIAPHIKSGLALASGQAEAFSIASDFALSFGLGQLSKSNPEAGVATTLFQTLLGFKGALQKPQQTPTSPITGSYLFTDTTHLLAAFDGKNLYYNFRLSDTSSKDISFLFKDQQEIFGNNIEIFKDFQDTSISVYPGNLDINGDLFINLKGKLTLDEKTAFIKSVDIISTKDAILPIKRTSPVPFIASLPRAAFLKYTTDNQIASISGEDFTFTTSTPLSSIITSQTTINLHQPQPPGYSIIISPPTKSSETYAVLEDGSRASLQLNIRTLIPILTIIEPRASRRDLISLQNKLIITTSKPSQLIAQAHLTATLPTMDNKILITSSPQEILVRSEENSVKILLD